MNVKKLKTKNNLIILGILLILLLQSTLNLVDDIDIGSVLGTTSPWIQTDWSGGAQGGTVDTTVNTYESKSQINAQITGNVTLDLISGWSSEYQSWSYRKKISFDNTQVKLGVTPTALADYPLLVKLNSSNINYNHTKDAGEDIRFADSDGTVLAYEIEKWNEAGDSYVWVKVPEIAVGNTDYIYIYYGNNSANHAQQTTQVWSSGYAGVWHLNETSGLTINDSSSSNNDGTKFAENSPPSINGHIDGAQNFNGGNNYITVPTSASLNPTNITISGWFTVNSLATWNSILMKSTDSNWANGYGIYYYNTLCGFVSNYATYKVCTPVLVSDVYNHVAITYNGSVLKMYINGLEVSSYNTTIAIAANNGSLFLGRGAGGYQWDGKLDELRINSLAKSPAWIAVEYQNGINNFNSFGSLESRYYSTGSLTSNVFDAGVIMDWGTMTYNYSGEGAVVVNVRTDNNSNMSGASVWESCNAVSNGTDITDNNCVDDGERYVQYQLKLSSSGATSPTFEDMSIAFMPSDQSPPEENGKDVEIEGLTSSGDWYKNEPIIKWTEGEDDENGNGILGYCIALDETDPDSSDGLNPGSISGVLQGKDDGVTQSFCPYIVIGEEFDVSQVQELNLQVGKEYFFSLKAVDLAGNIYNGSEDNWRDQISFKYDNEPPSAPFYVSLPSNFLSNKDVIVTWPVGVGGAQDIHSGLAGLQYRIGDTGTWYGDLHTGTEDINDLLVNDGSYITDETYDYPLLAEGNNLIYFRAVDNLGNVTEPEDYIKGLLKLNTVAPSPVRNLTVNPLDSEVNSYAFNWNPPATFTGSASGITYCYSVNTIPSENTCTFTSPGTTQLVADAFATQPGTNTMYVVAKDEAGNINYATYSEPGSSITFTYSGTAPGIPHNLDVADISVKATQNWRLVLSWDRPSNVGAGISYYNIYRSKTEAVCSNNFNLFTKVGSSTSTSYIDPDLEQKNYYYCIKACDSANNCSASSGTIGKLPTGKYTAPAELLTPPEVVSFTTRKAVISWVTDRVSDSSVEYGLESGKYFEAEVANSTQTAAHAIPLNNLEPGTTYYFRAKWTDVDGNTGISEEKTFATLPAPSVSNVSVSNITTNSAVVTFKVKNAVESTILYGLTESYGGSEIIPTSQTESTYTTQLRNLNEGSLYNFKFNLKDVDGNTYSYFENHQFHTLPFPRIENIQVEEVKNSSQPTVNINWESNVPISSRITFNPEDKPEQKRDQLDLEFKTEHTMVVKELEANRKYTLIVSGTDSLGNQATSDEYQFTTAEDSRPPEIMNLKVETRVSSTSGANQGQAQLIVTWDTDEAASSQIEYGEGSSGVYTQRTPEDGNLTFNHLVVINNLRPSSVYHLRAVSADSAGNEATGRNLVTISAQVSENPLDIIISRLTDIFGFIRL